MNKNVNICQVLELNNYINEKRFNRRKISKISGTAEFFTPYSIVKKMCDKISEEDWADPDKTFCEPCFGNGQFVIYINNVGTTKIGVAPIFIIDIGDVNGDGKYDINDFLDMNNDDILKKNSGKKFDVVLMNPPYQSNIELKFLKKAIEISNNIVSVQPVAWLQKPSNSDKKSSSINKYKDSICKHIKDIDIIKNAHDLFGIHGNVDIGIYTCDKEGGYDYEALQWSEISKEDYDKFYKSAKDFPKLLEYDENTDKAFVNIKTFANNARTTRYNIVAPNTYRVIYNGKLPNGDKWNSKKYKSNSLSKDKPVGIYFNTYKEAVNFYNSCLTECYKYIVSVFKHNGGVPLNYLPFMNDYTKEWTNERFFEYYNINKEKQKEIIEKMSPFMNENDLIK